MASAAERIIESLPYEVVCSTADERAWLEARKLGLGATDMSIVLGVNPWRSALQLFAEKVGAVEPEDLSDVEAVTWGKVLEPVVGAQYAIRTGRRYSPAGELLRSIEHPWALCTLDGWTGPARGEGPGGWPLEIKTTSAFNAEEWADGPPEHYHVQIQHQMLVTGSQRVTIACLLGGQRLVWCDVDRDETTIRRIVYNGERFWRRVTERDAPDPDGSESARRVIHALFPRDDGNEVELPMTLAEVVDEWQQLKRERKALEERITLAENTIKATLGDATRGYFPSGDAVSWKEQSMPERTLPATSFRVLRYHPSAATKQTTKKGRK